MNLEFVKAWVPVQRAVYKMALEKGWWDEPREDGTIIALIHSELSEALEGLRKDLISDKIPPFLAVEEELADVIIRIMDAAERRGWRVCDAVLAKIRYNADREYRHGGKRF